MVLLGQPSDSSRLTKEMQMAPLIGITGSGVSELPVQTTLHEAFHSVPTPYVECVARAGGVPVVLPPEAVDAAALLGKLDGIIFSGGADLHPKHYGGEASHAEVQQADNPRDSFELTLIKQAVAIPSLPILGICRGAQVLNVALGGTLFEHLFDHIDNDIHRPEGGGWTTHDVAVSPGSKLHVAMGVEHVHTVSGHHQALARIAAPLKVVARAEERVVEAVEHVSHPWCIAVQWHPERSAHEDKSQHQLFEALVAKACR